MSEKKTSLLIIDDHQIVSDGYKNLLEIEGFTVLGCAANADYGYQLYKNLKPDVTLVDISMPGKSGISCIEAIVKIDPEARIIVCTMYDETQIAAQAIRCGAKGFLTKDNPLSIMVKAISTVAKGEYYLGQRYAQALALMDIKQSEERSDRSAPLIQLDKLTAKEFSIFKMVAEGQKTEYIAEEMNLSARTVANYRSRIMRKLRVKNLRELTLIAVRQGVITSILEI